MANGDYGYFGKGSTGYAQYMRRPSTATLAARLAAVAAAVTTMAAETAAAAAVSSPLRWWSCWCLSPWEVEDGCH